MSVRLEYRSVVEIVTDRIVEAIVSGRVSEQIPLSVSGLSKELGVSSIPVREALRKLEALNLLESVPNRGFRVPKMTLHDLEGTYFVRLWLESLAIHEAAERFDEEAFERADEELLKRSKAWEQGDLIAVREAHQRFHFCCYEACGNPRLTQSILSPWYNSERYRVLILKREPAPRSPDQEHRELLGWLRARDSANAVTSVYGHLRRSAELIADALAGAGAAESMRLPSLERILHAVERGDDSSDQMEVWDLVPERRPTKRMTQATRDGGNA